MKKSRIIFCLVIILSIILVTINIKSTYSIETVDAKYVINVQNNIVYENSTDIDISIKEMSEDSTYDLIVNYENDKKIEKNLKNKNESIKLEFDGEGKKIVNIIIKKDNNEVLNETKYIYYIKPYEKQFLDEFSNKGVVVHFIEGTPTNTLDDDYLTSYIYLKNAGIKGIRSAVRYNSKNSVDYWNYANRWIKSATDYGVNNIVLDLLANSDNFKKESSYVGCQKSPCFSSEINTYSNFVADYINRYGEIIKSYEIINEPNYNYRYVTDEQVKYYSNLLMKIDEVSSAKSNNINIINGGVTFCNNADKLSSHQCITIDDFYKNLIEGGAYPALTSFAVHPYNLCNHLDKEGQVHLQNEDLNSKLKSILELLNNSGGFLKKYVTEYGVSIDNVNCNDFITKYNDATKEYYMKYDKETREKTQAQMLVQQTVLLDYYNVDFMSVYQLKNPTAYENAPLDPNYNHDRQQGNYGLLNSDYTPKLSYYAMKMLMTNINGAKYIGPVDLKDLYNVSDDYSKYGIDAHVYDKDGKPIIIAWTIHKKAQILLNNKNFIVKDIYGNRIISDANNQFVLTSYPVYIENADRNYFYQAIHNAASLKYEEFNTKFRTLLGSNSSIVDNLKNQIDKITTSGEISFASAKETMEKVYKIGNDLINLYKENKLSYKTPYSSNANLLSSMLDILNDIGKSFEDLITINLNSTNIDLNSINNIVKQAENNVEINKNIDNVNTNENGYQDYVYSEKIAESSRELYEKANYINNLSESNVIKNGLIYGYGLRSKLLATWSSAFSDIKVNECLNNSKVEIEYSNTKITNKDVTATIKSNSDFIINNNSKKKDYVFKENGEFTFEYTICGKKQNIKAVVNNIDTKSPVISGVENGKKYSSVTPFISDENEITLLLYKDSKLVSNYKNGDLIDKDGNYKLIATDNAQNTTTMLFSIEEPRYNYKVEYYYDGVKDNSKTVVLQGKKNTSIQGYQDKCINGYGFSHTNNLPLVITDKEQNNVIKVYYVKQSLNKKTLKYTVEYYKDNLRVDGDILNKYITVDNSHDEYIDIEISDINQNMYNGYLLEKMMIDDKVVSNLPKQIKNESIIKLFYSIKKYNYKILYYYDNVINNELTEKNTAYYEDVIFEYNDKSFDKYKLDKIENLPLSISDIENKNIIKIYYKSEENNIKNKNGVNKKEKKKYLSNKSKIIIVIIISGILITLIVYIIIKRLRHSVKHQ